MVVTFFKEETRLRRLQALIDNSNANSGSAWRFRARRRPGSQRPFELRKRGPEVRHGYQACLT
jgi:hypothetical protein